MTVRDGRRRRSRDLDPAVMVGMNPVRPAANMAAEQSRPSIPQRLRFEVLRRDKHSCTYCGATPPHARLTVDHVMPVALGGKTSPENLVTACTDCNKGKASIAPDEAVVADVRSDALRWSTAMSVAAQLQREPWEIQQRYVAEFEERWSHWSKPRSLPRPPDWEATIRRFYSLKLELDRLLDAVDVAMKSRAAASNVWRYFCGVCWHIVRERTEMALELLDDDDVPGQSGVIPSESLDQGGGT